MMTNKILDKINIRKIAKMESLNKVPVFEPSQNGRYVMCATSKYWAKGFLFKIITRTESDYIVKVNYKALNSLQKRYAFMCGSYQAAYDITYGLILHEFRHCYQDQIGFSVGQKADSIDTMSTELFYGHGQLPEEIDANRYMFCHALNEKQKALFAFQELEQESEGTFKEYDPKFNKELRKRAFECIRLYNPVWYTVLKALIYTVDCTMPLLFKIKKILK